MSETNFASLNPTLLARKGGAKPAMRPHLGAVPGMGMAGNVAQNLENLEDLGWNDMGHDDDAPSNDVVHLTPAPTNEEAAVEAAANDVEADAELAAPAGKPPVREQQETIAEKLAAVPEAPKPAAKTKQEKPASAGTETKRKPAAANGKRAAFTLRLDAERHLKLRLASTMKGRSAQVLVTEALDALLADIDDLDSLAAQVQQGPNQTKLNTGLNTGTKEGTEA